MSNQPPDTSGPPRYTNRLADEASPYLQQHAHNPVDWYPWGQAAFDAARASDKPVFLSVGYSTCHWCHVMADESFADEQVAEYLNEHFIAIKLDREQHPDLDDIYMLAVQLLSGQGGWPMSCFLTSSGEPFFAGTYYPRDALLELLHQLSGAWQDQRAEIQQQATRISAAIREATEVRQETASLDADVLGRANQGLLANFDLQHGGFGGAPKFPNESMLLLGWEIYRREPDSTLLGLLRLTMAQMAAGGIYDQIGGGFHRYAVDAGWQVPHFEKMLYNQAQLLRVYSEAYDLDPQPASLRVLCQTADYVLRDLCAPQGGFYSATDADSEGEEGRFFVWTTAQIDEALVPADAALIKALYQITATGNFEGRNIPHLEQSPEDYFAGRADMSTAVLEQDLTRLPALLLTLNRVRDQRLRPARDEKIITAWNGMMITALLLAGRTSHKSGYTDAAVRAAEYLWTNAFRGGQLWRIIMAGEVSIPGTLEDHAYFAEALLYLHKFTADDVWLARARQVTDEMVRWFWDDIEGGFFINRAATDGPLLTRPKVALDSAMPAANSVALAALVMLQQATGELTVEQRALKSLGSCASALNGAPLTMGYMLIQALRLRDGGMEDCQWAATGKVRATLVRAANSASIELLIASGWHINGSAATLATSADTERLLPTEVIATGAVQVTYPSQPIYAGKVEIALAGLERGQLLELVLQACSDDLCLAPQRYRFRF